METGQIILTEKESHVLHVIAQQTGKTPVELLREAAAQFIAQFQQSDRRALLRQARGLWKDRTDLPALQTLRDEFDRLTT